MNKVIAVDCDEVLVESLQGLINYVKKYHNYNREYDQVKNYFVSKNPEFDISDQEALDIFDEYFSSTEAKDIYPVDGAYEKLTHWRKLGYKLIVVTARNKKAENLTKYQLEKYYPTIFSDVHFVSHYTEHHIPKSQVCINIGASLLVEDNIDYTLEVIKCGIPCILLQKPWNNYRNESHNLITKVKNRKDISDDPTLYFIH